MKFLNCNNHICCICCHRLYVKSPVTQDCNEKSATNYFTSTKNRLYFFIRIKSLVCRVVSIENAILRIFRKLCVLHKPLALCCYCRIYEKWMSPSSIAHDVTYPTILSECPTFAIFDDINILLFHSSSYLKDGKFKKNQRGFVEIRDDIAIDLFQTCL